MTQDVFNVLYPVDINEAKEETERIDSAMRSTRCKHPKNRVMHLATIEKDICTKCGKEV